MSTPRFPLTFEPSGVTVWVEHGTTVLEAARRAGVIVPAPCGGRGTCGKCAVRIIDGDPEPPDEFEKVGLARAPQGLRLACRARIRGPLTVRPLIAGAVTSEQAHGPVEDDALLAAVDLGTTTVAALIVGAQSGRELGRATVPNAQQSFGGDVVSRISAALSGHADELKQAAQASVLEALHAACGAAGACLERTQRVVVAGNTAMTALLAGVDVTSLATAPYEVPHGVFGPLDAPVLAAALAQGAHLETLPGLGGFVGGDTTAGLLSSGLLSLDAGAAFVDIGTNAEIVVVGKGRAAYASAAAGPAFEGFGLTSGGLAVEGAIVAVRAADDLSVEVLGGGSPQWIAGSGALSAIAALRATGHLDETGLFSAVGPYASRFDTDEAGVVRVGLGPEGGPPFLTQLDVRAFQTAKAAVAAGLLSVTRAAGLKPRHIGRVVVGGSFGSALDGEDLVSLGVLPVDVRERIESAGDVALAGAAVAAFDPTALSELADFRRGAVRVELAADAGFSEMFARATALREYTFKRGF